MTVVGSARVRLVQRLQRAGQVVQLAATGAASWLLISSADSSWFDRIIGIALAVLALYAVSLVLGSRAGDAIPAWRPRNVWDAFAPFVFPFFLAIWARERDSDLVWLGWGLLLLSAVVQVLIWRVERKERAQEPA